MSKFSCPVCRQNCASLLYPQSHSNDIYTMLRIYAAIPGWQEDTGVCKTCWTHYEEMEPASDQPA